MASKGAYAEGTDGSDFSFRQRVDPVYQQSSYFKARLSLVSKAHTVLLVVAAAAAATFSTGTFPFHPALLLSLLLPLLSERGMKTNSSIILTAYSIFSALTAAYVLIVGVGRQLDQASEEGLTLYHISFLLLHLATVSGFLGGSYYARRLINLWSEAAFQRELREGRRAGAASGSGRGRKGE